MTVREDKKKARRKHKSNNNEIKDKFTKLEVEDFSSNTANIIKAMDFSSRMENRVPKTTPITDNYEISNHVLGLGINGKVVQCYGKKNKEKYALKVTIFLFSCANKASGFFLSIIIIK